MIDWEAAETALIAITRDQIVAFQNERDCTDLYGLGFFADLLEGVLLVANFESYHATNLRDYQVRWGLTDPEIFRWDTGNWQYPGGLDVDNAGFDVAWAPFREQILTEVQADESQELEDRCLAQLENLCIRVLDRLQAEQVFQRLTGLVGLIVLGHDDPQEVILPKKQRLDRILLRAGNSPI